jgi:hypothetical protein
VARGRSKKLEEGVKKKGVQKKRKVATERRMI